MKPLTSNWRERTRGLMISRAAARCCWNEKVTGLWRAYILDAKPALVALSCLYALKMRKGI